MIRTLNERLRANKEVFLTKDHSGLSEILFALRIAKKADNTSPFELQMGRKPNTFKSIVTDKTTRLDVDPDLKIESKDFLGKTGRDTRIMRKAARGSKLESLYKAKEIDESKVLAETDTTILVKTKKGNRVYSKRELGKRAKVQRRKQKVWAETENTGDDDNLISLSRGREKLRI